MNILLCDNELPKLKVLRNYLRDACGWRVAEDDSIAGARDRLATSSQLPDLMLLDLGFGTIDEDRLDLLEVSPSEVTESELRDLTGLKACADFARRIPELPIVILSKVYNPNLAALAYGAGARAYIQKGALASLIAGTLETIHRSLYPHHSVLYDQVNKALAASPEAFGEQRLLLSKASRQFFSNDDSSRRYARLCAQLSPLLGMAGSEDVAIGRMLPLMTTSHALLGLCVEGLPDHVLHSGNVFWLALCLWQTLGLWKADQRASCSGLSCTNDYIAALTVASLFHDIGYIGERAPAAQRSLSTILGADIRIPFAMEDKAKVAERINDLSTALAFAPDWASVLALASGSIRDGKLVPDHGLLGAAWLLETTGFTSEQSGLVRKIIMESACAVAMHTFEKWSSALPGMGTGYKFDASKSSTVWLLALCDFLQNWDREVPELYIEPGATYLDAKLAKARLTGWDLSEIKYVAASKELHIGCTGRVRWGQDLEKIQAKAIGDIRKWYGKETWRRVIEAHSVERLVVPVVKYEFIDGPCDTFRFSCSPAVGPKV